MSSAMERSNSNAKDGGSSSSPLSSVPSLPDSPSFLPVTEQQHGSQESPSPDFDVVEWLGEPAVTTASTAAAAATSMASAPAMPSLDDNLEDPESFFADLPGFDFTGSSSQFDIGNFGNFGNDNDNGNDPWAPTTPFLFGPDFGAGDQPDEAALAEAMEAYWPAGPFAPEPQLQQPQLQQPAAAAMPPSNPAPMVLGSLPPAVIEHSNSFANPGGDLLRWISGPHQRAPAVPRLEAAGGLLGPEGNEQFTGANEAGQDDGPLPFMFPVFCLEDESYGLPPIVLALVFIIVSVAATHEWGDDFLASGHMQVILNRLCHLLAGAALPYGPPSMEQVEDVFKMFRMAERQAATHRRWTDPTGLQTGLSDAFRHWAEFLRTEWRERTNGLDWLLKGLTRGFISKRDEGEDINLEGFWNPSPRRRPIFERDFDVRAPTASVFHYLVKLLQCLIDEAVICDIRVENPEDDRDKEEWEGHSHFIAKQKGAEGRRRQVGKRKAKAKAKAEGGRSITPASPAMAAATTATSTTITTTTVPAPAPSASGAMLPPPLPFSWAPALNAPLSPPSILRGAYPQLSPAASPYLATAPAPTFGQPPQPFGTPAQAGLPPTWMMPSQGSPWGMSSGGQQAQWAAQPSAPSAPVESEAVARTRRREELRRNPLPSRQQSRRSVQSSEEGAAAPTATLGEVVARPGGGQSRSRGRGGVAGGAEGDEGEEEPRPKRRRTGGIGEDAAQDEVDFVVDADVDVNMEDKSASSSAEAVQGQAQSAPWSHLGAQEPVGEDWSWQEASKDDSEAPQSFEADSDWSKDAGEEASGMVMDSGYGSVAFDPASGSFEGLGLSPEAVQAIEEDLQGLTDEDLAFLGDFAAENEAQD